MALFNADRLPCQKLNTVTISLRRAGDMYIVSRNAGFVGLHG